MSTTTTDPELFAALYAALKPRAHQLLNGFRGETLNTTSLVHEAFLKLKRSAETERSESHLYRTALLAMRQILIDRLRQRESGRHGGGLKRVGLTDLPVAAPDQPHDLAVFHEALEKLRKLDAKRAETFEMRALLGLEFHAIGAALDINEVTARRHFKAAATLVAAWLD
jgi:RNA polymerase sigma factor (TIGR02999 family)